MSKLLQQSHDRIRAEFDELSAEHQKVLHKSTRNQSKLTQLEREHKALVKNSTKQIRRLEQSNRSLLERNSHLRKVVTQLKAVVKTSMKNRKGAIK